MAVVVFCSAAAVEMILLMVWKGAPKVVAIIASSTDAVIPTMTLFSMNFEFPNIV
jgi:hypothetical protein